MKDMKLEIKNFGPINEAEIDIGKITVIAGPNASGKTTSSKLFYCFLASSSSEGAYIINASIIQRLDRPLNRVYFNSNDERKRDKLRDLRRQLISSADFVGNDEILERYFNTLNELHIDIDKSEIEGISRILSVMGNSVALYEDTLTHLLQIEFNKPSLIDSEVTLKQSDIHKNQFEVSIREDGVHNVTPGYLKFFEVKNVSYIETPYILDFFSQIRGGRYPHTRYGRVNRNHQSFLIDKLYDNEKDVFDRTLNENIIQVQKKIEKIINGTLKFDDNANQFVFEQGDHSFHSKDVAGGIKSLGILQMLLENRQLPEDSYLIMDEPEVHLHPAWQVKLAEILVLLSKELDVTVYVNSHSPQFVEAIEVYSRYYGIGKDTNFYLTAESENGKFDFRKVERKNLNKIYDCLGSPYDILDKIIGKNDARDVIKGRD